MVKFTGLWAGAALWSAVLLLLNVNAYRKNSIPVVDEYKYEDGQEHRTKYNYYSEKQIRDDALANDLREVYSVEPLEFDEEELPGLVVDYANMIRNDIVLLDNSVQTQTRKRANFKVEKKYSSSEELPCTCELNKTDKVLDVGYFTRTVVEVNCSDALCPGPYKCERRQHFVPLLRQIKSDETKISALELPDDLRHRWLVRLVPITVGCLCKRSYTLEN